MIATMLFTYFPSFLLLQILPIWPQVQSMLSWLLAGLFGALAGLMTKYSLPQYSSTLRWHAR